MKARELKELGVDQLKEKLAQLNLDLFNYHHQVRNNHGW